MPDPNPSLSDQVKNLTDQVATLQSAQNHLDIVQKSLNGDFTRRFEQLTVRIDQQNASFTTLSQELNDLRKESVAHKISLPFDPSLNGGWLNGTTSGNTPVIPQPVPIAQNVFFQLLRLTISGSMPITLPNLSRIELFQASFDFNALPPGPLQGTLNINLQRGALTANNSEAVVQLGGVPGNTVSQNGPAPGMELIDNDLFTYSVVATFSLFTTEPVPPGFPLSIPQGLVVLKSFRVGYVAD